MRKPPHRKTWQSCKIYTLNIHVSLQWLIKPYLTFYSSTYFILCCVGNTVRWDPAVTDFRFRLSNQQCCAVLTSKAQGSRCTSWIPIKARSGLPVQHRKKETSCLDYTDVDIGYRADEVDGGLRDSHRAESGSLDPCERCWNTTDHQDLAILPTYQRRRSSKCCCWFSHES